MSINIIENDSKYFIMMDLLHNLLRLSLCLVQTYILGPPNKMNDVMVKVTGRWEDDTYILPLIHFFFKLTEQLYE